MSLFETFGEIKRELAFRAGYATLDDAGAQYEAAIERSVNQILRHIHAEAEHEFRRKQDIKNTIARVDVLAAASTACNVTKGATTVTFDADPTNTDWLGADIAIDDGNEIYAIVKLTDATTIEIHPAYRGDTVTSGAYSVVQAHITLPDDCDTLLSVTHLDDDYELISANYATIRHRIANPYVTDVDDPTHYAFDTPLELTTPGATEKVKPDRLLLVPMPTTAINLGLDYFKIPTELSSDSDVPDIPPQHRQTLVEGSWLQIATTWGNRRPQSLSLSQAIYARGLANLQRRRVQVGQKSRLGSYRQYPVMSGEDQIPVIDVYESQWSTLP